MRGLSAWRTAWTALAAATAVVPVLAVNPAGPVPMTGAGANPALRAEALSFASELQRVFAVIDQAYIRPVSHVDLADAIVCGLYEAAREPYPLSLRHELRKADDSELPALLARVRESLGFHDALRGNRALLVAYQSLPRALDPYCGITTPQERTLDREGNVTGVGLEFPIVAPTPASLGTLDLDGLPVENSLDRASAQRLLTLNGPMRILNVLPGSPAQRAGLRPDDLIIQIDGHSPEHPAFGVLFRRLLPVSMGVPLEPTAHGFASSRLTVLRPGGLQTLHVAVTPVTFKPESAFGATRRPDGTWDYRFDTENRLGYIRLGAIGYQSPLEVKAALQKLQANSVRGLILDLRWCPGGYLIEAATIAHLFLPPDVNIASQRERSGKVDPVLPDELGGSFAQFPPIVVLVNGETSGGGELIAGALQDYGRALIVGQRTVGKASVQKPLPRMPFKITTGTFLRPSGKNLQRFPDSKPDDDWGIRPDAGRELPLTTELSRRLKEWHTRFALRPAADREALPLDDPENDPQRQAALQMLRELVKKAE